jgi:hypothetical protein
MRFSVENSISPFGAYARRYAVSLDDPVSKSKPSSAQPVMPPIITLTR